MCAVQEPEIRGEQMIPCTNTSEAAELAQDGATYWRHLLTFRLTFPLKRARCLLLLMERRCGILAARQICGLHGRHIIGLQTLSSW